MRERAPFTIEHLVGLPVWTVNGRSLVRREYIDGPRYVEAIRGAREMRRESAISAGLTPANGQFGMNTAVYWDFYPRPPERREHERGIPEGWFGR